MQDRIPPGLKGFLLPLVSTLVVGAGLAGAARNEGWYGLASSASRTASEPTRDADQSIASSHTIHGPAAQDDRSPVAIPRLPLPVPLQLNCSIVQTGNPTDTLWWFGGADAQEYAERVTLSLNAHPREFVPPIRWQVVRGQNKVSFLNGTDVVVTQGTTVEVLSSGPSAPAATLYKDIEILATDATNRFCTYPLVVYAPEHLVRLSTSTFFGTDGYISEVEYRTETQFNQVLPYPVELNSDWGAEISDFAGEDWIWRSERSALVDPSSWVDRIARNSAAIFTTPPLRGPMFPLGTVKVDHRFGQWKHGSLATFAGPSNNGGIAVMNLTWQIYQDHADNE